MVMKRAPKLVLQLLLLLLYLSTSSSTSSSLLVCRNLHLDEAWVNPETQQISFNIGSASSDDTDVTALLRSSGDTSKLRPDVFFTLQLKTDVVNLGISSIDYSTNGAGVKVSSSDKQSPDASSSGGWSTQRFSVPPSAYIGTSAAPWTDMRSLSLTLNAASGPSPGGTRVRLLRLCEDVPSPNFCAITTTDTYKANCAKCNCRQCHNCGCTPHGPFHSCGSRGSCDSDCWCSVQGVGCKCCNDCDATECDCQTCCDDVVTTGCSSGTTFGVTDVEPESGISGDSTNVIVRGFGFAVNGPGIKCRFGGGEGGVAVDVPATFVSTTSLSCIAPPRSLPSGTLSLPLLLSVSMDGQTFSDSTTADPPVTFTYHDCGASGCSDRCPAASCRCAPGFFGPACSSSCDCDASHSTCGSVTGSCFCQAGFAGRKCDSACATASVDGKSDAEPCAGRGSCVFDVGKDEAVCKCLVGYWGRACDRECPKDELGVTCGGRGTCDSETGRCLCFSAGFYGPSCSSHCPGVLSSGSGLPCSGFGTCCTDVSGASPFAPCRGKTLGSCSCLAGHVGANCDVKVCVGECYGNGECDRGTCKCAEGWTGDFCAVEAGVDPNLSYMSFEKQQHFTDEDVGTITVNVTRYGSLMNDVSVLYATRDLTAKSETDYSAAQNRLLWVAQSAEVKQIKVLIFKSPDVEGEESFEIVLSSPLPSGSCQLGRIWKTTVVIAAKSESGGGGSGSSRGAGKVARITIRLAKSAAALEGVAGDEMRHVFVLHASAALMIDPARLYILPGAVVASAEGGGITSMFTFDILPPPEGTKGDDVGTLARRFVGAVADFSSALYSDEMKASCPIDVAFQPDVHVIDIDPREVKGGGGGNGSAVSISVSLLVILISASGGAWFFRRQLREIALRKLARWKFDELNEEGGEVTSPVHDGSRSFMGRVQGAVSSAMNSAKFNSGGDSGGYGFVHRHDSNDFDLDGESSRRRNEFHGAEDGTELVTMRAPKSQKDEEEVEGTEQRLVAGKKVLQIEL